MKLIVTGYAQHGKDTVCEILRDKYGFSFESSSRILLDEVIFPVLAPKYGYASKDECFADRINHRQEWFDLLVAYNTPNSSRLGALIFSKYDIYCGLRNRNELLAMKEAGLFDYLVWVDAKERTRTTEPSTSMTIIPELDADFVLDNNGSKTELVGNIAVMVGYLFNMKCEAPI